MSDNSQFLDGKIAALRPSFLLLGELTGRAATPEVMKFYTEKFAGLHLAMDDVNQAVEVLLVGWKKSYWPSVEEIAAKAKEIRAQAAFEGSVGHARWQEIEQVYQQADDAKWIRRLEVANRWRMTNPIRFKLLLDSVNGDLRRFVEVLELQWMIESKAVRQAFKDGAIVGGCLCEAGIDDRRQERLEAADRARRAKQFGVTGEIPEAA